MHKLIDAECRLDENIQQQLADEAALGELGEEEEDRVPRPCRHPQLLQHILSSRLNSSQGWTQWLNIARWQSLHLPVVLNCLRHYTHTHKQLDLLPWLEKWGSRLKNAIYIVRCLLTKTINLPARARATSSTDLPENRLAMIQDCSFCRNCSMSSTGGRLAADTAHSLHTDSTASGWSNFRRRKQQEPEKSLNCHCLCLTDLHKFKSLITTD